MNSSEDFVRSSIRRIVRESPSWTAAEKRIVLSFGRKHLILAQIAAQEIHGDRWASELPGLPGDGEPSLQEAIVIQNAIHDASTWEDAEQIVHRKLGPRHLEYAREVAEQTKGEKWIRLRSGHPSARPAEPLRAAEPPPAPTSTPLSNTDTKASNVDQRDSGPGDLAHVERPHVIGASHAASPSTSVKIGIAAGIGCALLWLPMWLVANIVIKLIYTMRGDPLWAWTLMKELGNSCIAIYLAFAVVSHFARRVDWRIAYGAFVLAAVSYTGYQGMWNAEYYLTAGRVAEFRSTMVWMALSTVGALITALIMAVKCWPLRKAQS